MQTTFAILGLAAGAGSAAVSSPSVAAAAAAAAKSWVDPDTPEDGLVSPSLVDGKLLSLVFSDEFEVPGRTFDNGHDPRWTAIHKNDYTNTALQFYDKRAVTTGDGFLNITTSAEDTTFDALNDETMKYHKKTKHFKSGMVQSWNKFCFTGGIVEVRARLPGDAYIGGLWPAMWLMGNLARATYVGSSDWLWPWSYDHCDPALQPKQLISSCNPNPHYAMESHTGRGAPEIDILEAMPGKGPLLYSKVGKPYFSTSLQIAPGITENRPGNGLWPGPGQWYEGLEFGDNSTLNIFFYGTVNAKTVGPKALPKYVYQSDAISSNTQLDERHWRSFHKYRVEWELPENLAAYPNLDDDEVAEVAGMGYIRWYMDDKLVYGIRGKGLAREGGQVPSEPSYLIFNVAMSSTWGFPNPCPENCECECHDCHDVTGKCTCGIAPGFCDSLPAAFLVDYVRVYQNANVSKQKVGCSTPERPTSTWIKGHVDSYKDDWEARPLEAIQNGGGACRDDSQCGTFVSPHLGKQSRGRCHVRLSECHCFSGWTGPHCLAHDARDPVDWEAHNFLAFYAIDWRYVWRPLAMAIVPILVAIATVALRLPAGLTKPSDQEHFTLGRNVNAHTAIGGWRPRKRTGQGKAIQIVTDDDEGD